MALHLSGCGSLGIEQSRRRFDTKMFEMFLKFHEKQFVTHRARFHPSLPGRQRVLKVSWKARKPSLKFQKCTHQLKLVDQSFSNNNKNTGSDLIMFDLILKLHFATSSTGSPSLIQDTMGDYKHNNMLQDHLTIACEQSPSFLRGEGVCTQAICESPSLIVFLSRWDQTTPQMYRIKAKFTYLLHFF